MTKYRNFQLFLLSALCLVTATGQSIENKPTVRPNIIWLVAEDQSPQFFPMYGDSIIRLPNLERLSHDALSFNRVYAPVPVCAPARSAIITGMYPTTLGTHNMRTYNAYRPRNEINLGIPSYSPIVPDGVRVFTEYLRNSGYYCTNNAKEDYNFKAPIHSWDDSSKDAHWRNRPQGKPFFSVFNFEISHESGIWKYKDSTQHVDENLVEVPPYFPNTRIVRHDLATNYSNLYRLDQQIGKIIDQLKDDGLYESSYVFFFSDHGGPFPRYKRSLYETGIRVPMILKFPEQKMAGLSNDDLISFIDLAPTVLSIAGIEPPTVMQGIALYGKFKSEIRREFLMASSDRFDEIVDRKRAVIGTRFKYIRNYNPELSRALPISYREQMPMMKEMRALFEAGRLNSITHNWFSSPIVEEELYDLENDTFELVNLVDEPKWRETVMTMRTVLENWIQDTNDLGRIPEAKLLELWFEDAKTPKLPTPEVLVNNQQVRLFCNVEDATILWRRPNESWQLYNSLISAGQNIEAKAVRIGYDESDLLIYTPE